ncbi:MAG: DinB family protein [Anaerolineales bacterium]|nr:DinB family protein [Anaerolineales bacterium]
MLPSQTVRNWQFSILNNAYSSIKYILEQTDTMSLTTYRDGGNGWTALEVLAHLRDFEGVFYERISLAKTQDNPVLPFPDPDQLALTNTYNTLPVWEVYTAWGSARQRLMDYMATFTEEDWLCPAQHPTRGAISIQDQLFLIAWHDVNHIEQMTRILRERQA